MNLNIFYSNYIYQKKKYLQNNYKGGSDSVLVEQNEIFNQYDVFYDNNLKKAIEYIEDIYSSDSKDSIKLQEINKYLLNEHFLSFIKSLSDKNISQYLTINIENYNIKRVIKKYFEINKINDINNKIHFIIDVYTQFIYWYICIYSAEPFQINYNTSKIFFTERLELEKWIDLYENYDKVKYYLYFAPFVSNIMYKYFENFEIGKFEIEKIHYFFDNKEENDVLDKEILNQIKLKIDQNDYQNLIQLLKEYFNKIQLPEYSYYMERIQHKFNQKNMNENKKTKLFLKSLESLDKEYFQYFYNDVIEQLLLLVEKDDIQGGSQQKYTGRKDLNERKQIFNKKYDILSNTLNEIKNKINEIKFSNQDSNQDMENKFNELLKYIKNQREIIFMKEMAEFKIKNSVLNIDKIFENESEKSEIFIPIVYVNNFFDYLKNHVIVIHKILDNGEYKYYYFDPNKIKVEKKNKILELLTTQLNKNNILNYLQGFENCNLLSQSYNDNMCTYISILYILLNYKFKDEIKNWEERIQRVCSIIDNWITCNFIIEFIKLLIRQFQEDLSNETFEFKSLLNIINKLNDNISNNPNIFKENDASNIMW